MDSEKFEALAAQTRLGEQAIGMARDILVNGLSAAQAAKKAGVSRQLAAQAARRIVRQMHLTDRFPEDWLTVTATLPKQWAQLVRYIQTVENQKHGLIVKGVPQVPEFELTDIAEFSRLVETILKQWRKL